MEAGDTGAAFPKSAPFAARLGDVAVAGRRLVAVGNDGQGKPLVMLSGSPGAWRKVPFKDGAARLEAVTASRGVFTIVGWRVIRGRASGAVWTSWNGRSWQRAGGPAPTSLLVDVTQDASGLVALGLEGSSRGLQTSVWSRGRGLWYPSAALGPGEAQALCSGPNGATALATIGAGPRSRVLTWSRVKKGPWSSEPDVVSVGGFAASCADGPRGTVVVGDNENGAAVAWRRTRPGTAWKAAFIGATVPPTRINDVVRDGAGYLATGTTGDRGQSDLAIWRSSDGVRWTRIGGTEPAFLEPGFQSGFAIVRARGRIVVTGSHGAGNAGLWVGTP